MLRSPNINVMTAAAIKAAKGLQRDFGEVDQLQVSRKGTSNFVTQTDIRAEKLLIRELRKARPDYGFLVEEAGEIAGKDPHHRWIIDPLDGTSNFIHANAYFCISIALEKKDSRGVGEIIASVIYNPLLNEMFTAERARGAFCNDRRMQVSQRKTPDEMMFATGNPQHVNIKKSDAMRLFQAVSDTGAAVRYFGATALDLAHVAAGRYDAAWFGKLQPWDAAAGLLLVREAGGFATDFSGKAATIHSPSLVVGSTIAHPAMMEHIRTVLGEQRATA